MAFHYALPLRATLWWRFLKLGHPKKWNIRRNGQNAFKKIGRASGAGRAEVLFGVMNGSRKYELFLSRKETQKEQKFRYFHAGSGSYVTFLQLYLSEYQLFTNCVARVGPGRS
jgi:hypothetical protein